MRDILATATVNSSVGSDPPDIDLKDLDFKKTMSVPSAISFPVNSGSTQQNGTRR